MEEKNALATTHTDAPPPDYHPSPSGNDDVPPPPWDPRTAPPPPQQQLGTYAPGSPMVAGAQPTPQPGMLVPGPGGQMVMLQGYPTSTFCPATGAAHIPRTRRGALGIVIGIVFCPIGLLAIPFDKKTSCTQCRYVIKESWGGC